MFYTNVQPHGNSIAIRGVKDGKHFKTKIPYEPTLYVHSQKPQSPQWKTLEGKPVAPVKWGSMKESREAIRNYAGDVFGVDQFQYSFISDHYPGLIEYDMSQIRIGYIDIECSSENGFPNIGTADEEILAISYKCGDDFKVYACGEYISEDFTEYIRCVNEKELLTRFIDDWARNYPDIITGWNTRFFDIPYLVNRCKRVLGERATTKLSPWGWFKESKVTLVGGREQQVYELVGISSIDYMDTYKKFTFTNRESYALNFIAYTELGEKKLDY